MLAVNDNAGNHTGKVSRIAIGDEIDGKYLQLECLLKRGAACKSNGDKIRIGWKTFAITGYSTHVGNIVWDCAHVTAKVAADIANKLHAKKDYIWSCFEATDCMAEKWNHDEPIFHASDFEQVEIEQ